MVLGLLSRVRRKAGALRVRVAGLYLAVRDPRVPRLSKLIIVLVVAYALSPIDLIPDVIPVLGLLDDLVIIPLGVWLAIRLMPAAVWADCERRAAVEQPQLPRSRTAAVCILLLWLLAVVLVSYGAYLWLQSSPAGSAAA